MASNLLPRCQVQFYSNPSPTLSSPPPPHPRRGLGRTEEWGAQDWPHSRVGEGGHHLRGSLASCSFPASGKVGHAKSQESLSSARVFQSVSWAGCPQCTPGRTPGFCITAAAAAAWAAWPLPREPPGPGASRWHWKFREGWGPVVVLSPGFTRLPTCLGLGWSMMVGSALTRDTLPPWCYSKSRHSLIDRNSGVGWRETSLLK